MATRNLIPRGSGEGGLGIETRPWGTAFFDSGNFTSGITVGGNPVPTGFDIGGGGGAVVEGDNDNINFGGTDPADTRDINFMQGGENVMVINEEGNVNIENNLSVSGSLSGKTGYFEDDIFYRGQQLDLTNLGKWNDSTTPGNIYYNGGDVGIGTTNPDRLLDVENSGGHAFISVVGKNDSRAAILLGDTDSDSQGRIDYDNSDNHLHFSTAQTERMRIDSAGNVGIGTTSPDLKLEVANGNSNTRSKVSLEPASSVNRSLDIYSDGVINSYNTNFTTVGSAGLQLQVGGTTYINIKGGDPAVDTTVGNVGIGTTSPAEMLTLTDKSSWVAQTNGPAIQFEGKTNNGTLYHFAKIKAISPAGGTNNAGQLGFYTTNAGVDVERVRIDEDGNVGIGTTNPGSKLHVNGTIQFGDGHTIGNGGGDNLHITSSSGENIIIQASGGTNAFWGQTSEHMRIDSNGNVGIGTTDPSAKLEVLDGNIRLQRTDALNSQLHFANSTANMWSLTGDGDNDFVIERRVKLTGAFINKVLSIEPTTTEAMRIDSAGNVGIGTTNPAGSKLFVKGDQTNEAAISISADNSVGEKDASIFFNATRGVNNAGSNGEIRVTHDGGGGLGKMLFGTRRGSGNPTTAMTIDSAGNVGIGTTSPVGKLHVTDLSVSIGNVTVTNTGTGVTGGTDLNTKISNGDRIKINGEIFTVSAVAATTLTLSGTPSTAGTFTAYTDSNGLVVTSAGNVGIGTTSPSAELDVVGAIKTSGSITAGGSSSSVARHTIARADVNGAWDMQPSLYLRLAPGTQAPPSNDNSVIFSNANGIAIHASTADVGNNTYTPHLLVKNNGNVGIGTTNPGAKLEVDYIASTQIGLTLNGSNTTLNNAIKLTDASDNAITLSINAGKFGINGGDVGIGTTDPKVIHHISTATQANNYAVTRFTADSQEFDVGVGGSNAAITGIRNKFYIFDSTISQTRLVMDGSGNVGIGTTNPAQKLDVYGNIAVNGVTVHTSDDRVKHNEQPIVGALETLSKITPKKYIKTVEMYDANHDFELDADGNPIDSNGEPVEHRIEAGVVAQQVLTVGELAFAVSPEGVDEDGTVTSPHGLDYNSLFTYAIAAIQELKSEIDSLKSQLNPDNSSSTQEPVVEEVSKEPAVEEVSKEPAVEEVSEEPAVEEVSEEPAVEEVSEESNETVSLGTNSSTSSTNLDELKDLRAEETVSLGANVSLGASVSSTNLDELKDLRAEETNE